MRPTVRTWLTPGDHRGAAAAPTTVEAWLRGAGDGGTDVTLSEWIRGGGSERSLVERSMPLINRYAARELSADEVIVRGMLLCNSRRDFYYSRFSKAALREVAQLAPGAPNLRMHDYRSGKVEGRFFDARVRTIDPGDGSPASDHHWVDVMNYFLNNEEGKLKAQRIDGGLDKEVSIGFSLGRTPCSECADPMYACRHIPGDIYTKGIAEYGMSGVLGVLEGSDVFRGGQKETTTYIPEGAGSQAMAAVAGAVDRYLEFFSGEMDWSQIGAKKREFLLEIDRMPRAIRVAVESHRRAMGFGVLCAEPGDRRNTQAVVCSKSRFKDEAAAARWARDQEFPADVTRHTADAYVFEQFSESELEPGSLKERKLQSDPGVSIRVGKVKPKEETDGRSVRGWLAGASSRN